MTDSQVLEPSASIRSSQSQVIDSQSATFPAEGSNSQSQQIPEAGSWAKLIGKKKAKHTNIWLKKDFFKFGQVPECCDLSLKNIDFDPRLKMDKVVSKIHFVISKINIRGKTVAQIKDLSTRGTFVNGDLIGTGNIRILGNDDWIGVVRKELELWKFTYLWLDEPIFEIPATVRMDYLLIDSIGEGRFCKVYYIMNKKTCRHFAMKCAKVSLDIDDEDGLLNEANLLKSIKHESIITYHDTILVNSDMYLILEYINGENLNTILRRKGRLSESYARNIAQQILSGLAHLHALKIAHRNIRPKNILLNANENDPTAKIANFKLSKVLRKGVSTVKNIGMSVYDAPETKIGEPGKGKFDMRVDIWSFGVLLYVCLCGREPLEGGENRAPGTIFFSPKDVWSRVSELAKTCVKACLVPNYENRIQAKYLLFQPWFIVNFKSNVKSYAKRPNILKSESTPKRYKSSEHE